MAFDENAKAMIRQIAFEAMDHGVSEIKCHINEAMKISIELHQATCPHGRAMQDTQAKMEAIKNQAIGGWRVIAFFATLISSVIALGVSVYGLFNQPAQAQAPAAPVSQETKK